MIELLLKYKANPLLQKDFKATLLFIMQLLMETLKMRKYYFKAGADVNAIGMNLRSPLHTAVYSGEHFIVELILKFKPNIDLKDSNNKTALEIAKERDLQEIISFLESK